MSIFYENGLFIGNKEYFTLEEYKVTYLDGNPIILQKMTLTCK